MKTWSCNGFFTALLFSIVFVVLFITSSPSYAHLYGYNVQELNDPKNDVLVEFGVEPETPSVGENVALNFSVQNLQTGSHLTNFSDVAAISYYDEKNPSANDIVGKFSDKNVKNGDFDHSFIFEKGGTYEIFLRIDTPTFINVSKFIIFVSSPQFQIINLVYLLLPFMIFSGVIVGIGIIIWRYIYKKR